MGDLFDGIEKAEQFKQAVYLRPGLYEDLEILEVKTDRTRKDQAFFAVEFQVIKSSGEGANPPGSKCSLMTLKAWDGFLKDVRTWCAAMYGVEFEKVDGPSVRLTTTKAQPLKGAHVRIEAWNKTTKKNEADFTQSKWEHISRPEDFKDRVKAAKAEIAAAQGQAAA
jgi:hypothetical protein